MGDGLGRARDHKDIGKGLTVEPGGKYAVSGLPLDSVRLWSIL